jgi:hypothetical protein
VFSPSPGVHHKFLIDGVRYENDPKNPAVVENYNHLQRTRLVPQEGADPGRGAPGISWEPAGPLSSDSGRQPVAEHHLAPAPAPVCESGDRSARGAVGADACDQGLL